MSMFLPHIFPKTGPWPLAFLNLALRLPSSPLAGTRATIILALNSPMSPRPAASSDHIGLRSRSPGRRPCMRLLFSRTHLVLNTNLPVFTISRLPMLPPAPFCPLCPAAHPPPTRTHHPPSCPTHPPLTARPHRYPPPALSHHAILSVHPLPSNKLLLPVLCTVCKVPDTLLLIALLACALTCAQPSRPTTALSCVLVF